MPVLAVVGDVLAHAIEVGHDLVELADRQAPLPHLVVPARLAVRPIGLLADDRADAVQDQVQRPGCGDGRVFLAQRAGGGVARVHIRRLAGLGLPLVQLVEGGHRQEHLTAHLERRRPARTGQLDRGGRDRADVRCNILAGRAVASGRGPDQHSVLVDEVDRQAVDLEFAQERAGAAEALSPGVPAVKFFGGESIVQAV